MFKNIFKIKKLEKELAEVERKYVKYQQTKKYKSLTSEEKHMEEDCFYQGEYRPLWQEIEALKDGELLRKAANLFIPFPSHWEDKESKYWRESDLGSYYLKTEGKHYLIKAIREEEKARREAWVWWIPLLSAISSFFGAILGVILGH